MRLTSFIWVNQSKLVQVSMFSPAKKKGDVEEGGEVGEELEGEHLHCETLLCGRV